MSTVALSGVVFAALHWIVHAADPFNQFGGFLLAWVYLESGSLAVPLALHALANLAFIAESVARHFL
jgi:membrane protease YdiL (CAAX protease family)